MNVNDVTTDVLL